MEPFSFYAKIVSKIMKKRKKKLFNDMNSSGKSKKKFSLFKELIFYY